MNHIYQLNPHILYTIFNLIHWSLYDFSVNTIPGRFSALIVVWHRISTLKKYKTESSDPPIHRQLLSITDTLWSGLPLCDTTKLYGKALECSSGITTGGFNIKLVEQ